MAGRVCGTDGKPPLREYHRIVAVNAPEKIQDIFHHVAMFLGRPFTLHLTTHRNTFELVIVDESDTFIHFHKELMIIAATLHIRGKQVAREFIEIFDDLTSRDNLLSVDCLKVTPAELGHVIEDVERLFEKQFGSHAMTLGGARSTGIDARQLAEELHGETGGLQDRGQAREDPAD
jgi:hypothetical protein